MIRAAIAAVVSLASIGAASAQWIAQQQGGEFDDNPTNIALTAKGKHAIGFRCSGDELKVVFITPEEVDDADTLRLMNAAGPQIRLKIDNGAVVSLDAELDETNGTLGVLADVDIDLVKSVASAKSKLSAVLTLLGKNYHETTFNVRGSTAAIDKIIKNCKLGE